MKKEVKVVLIILLIIALALSLIFLYEFLFSKNIGTSENPNSQIANPASVNCVNKGGTIEIRSNEDGSQIGYCIFPNGTECEEWAFYRGEC